MLKLTVCLEEGFNEQTNEFVEWETIDVELEHSLVSLSKWEQFFEKPFLGRGDKSPEEMLWYIQAMCTDPKIPPEVFQNLSRENIIAINDYIGKKMTASWVNEQDKRPSRQVVTSELIYYWMAQLSIPFDCERWHLNRLFMLIKISNELNKPKQKMSKRDVYSRNAALNAQRRAATGSTG